MVEPINIGSDIKVTFLWNPERQKVCMKTCPGEKLYLVVGYGSRDDGVMGKSREEGTRMEEKWCFLNSRVYFPCDTGFQRTGHTL